MTPTPEQQAEAFRQALAHLSLSQSAAAVFFQVDVSTIRRWAQRGPPPLAQMILAYLIAEDMTLDAFLAAIRRKGPR